MRIRASHLEPGSRSGPELRAVAMAALAIAVCFALLGCSTPTKPEPVKYNIYIGCLNTDQMYVYDADSLTLIDSIPGLGDSYSMVVSPDGRWLYVEGSHDGNANVLVKVDSRTKQEVAVLPSDGPTEVAGLKAGRLILRGNPLFYSEVIDTERMSLVRSVDDSLYWRDGPQNGTKIATTALMAGPPGPDQRVRVLDIETGAVYGNYVPRLQSGEFISTYRVVLHPDGKRVLVSGPGPGRSVWFVIGDVTTGATLLQHQLTAEEGDIGISDDGLYAVVTDPSRLGYPEMPTPTTDVFDLQTPKHLKRFMPADFSSWSYCAQIQFLGDSKRVVLAPRPGTGGPLYVIDLVTLVVEKTIWLPPDLALSGALGVGPRPKE